MATRLQGVRELRRGQSAQGFVDNKHSAMVAEKKSRKLLTEKLGHVLLLKLNTTRFYQATYTWGPLTSQRGLCEETWTQDCWGLGLLCGHLLTVRLGILVMKLRSQEP